jgi:AraC-like DNA-binding protein
LCDPAEYKFVSITFVEKRQNYSSFLALKNRRLYPDKNDLQNILKIIEGVQTPDAPPENTVLPLISLLLNQRRKIQNIPEPRERHDFFSRMCDYVREHFDDNISVKMLANEFNVTTETVRRQFHHAGSDLTPKKMISLLRHQLAIELLEHTDMRIAEIAKRCGFADSFSFSRAFKRVDGNSPLLHRKKYKI